MEEGDEVSGGDTIRLIEAMKDFNEVKVEAYGKISKFLVENEEAVDGNRDLAELE